jgi:hypothetical protein
MTTYQELCLAASRGARMQFNPMSIHGHDQGWVLWRGVIKDYAEQGRLRIHPQDKHFRFGPISKALHEAAKEPPEYLQQAVLIDPFFYPCWNFYDSIDYDEADRDTRSTFLLLMAEAIASEGL